MSKCRRSRKYHGQFGSRLTPTSRQQGLSSVEFQEDQAQPLMSFALFSFLVKSTFAILRVNHAKLMRFLRRTCSLELTS